MNSFFKTLGSLIMFVFIVACAEPTIQAKPASQEPPIVIKYQDLFGKLLDDKSVRTFVANNNCTLCGQFYLCQSTGIALWIDHHGVIRTTYLYLQSKGGFAAYQGELPFGLVLTDTMADIERKFGQPQIPDVPQAGFNPGLPEESGTPDYIHYWAVYQRFDVTIVYDSPFAYDKSVAIYFILINYKPFIPIGPSVIC